MPKLDEAKERLGILKFWLGIFVVFFGGLVSWIATNYKNYNDLLVFYGACILAAVLLILIILAIIHSKKILKEIRDIKK